MRIGGPEHNFPSTHTDDSHGSTLHVWGGCLRKLPQTFCFPSVDLANAWQLWWLGNKHLSWPPFRFLDTIDMCFSTQRRQLTEWRFAMNYLRNIFERTSRTKIPSKPSEIEVLQAFEAVLPHVKSICSVNGAASGKRRVSQLKLLTVVRDLRRHARSQHQKNSTE